MSQNSSKRLLYGLVGYPIEHSRSPQLFEAYSPLRGLASYQLFPIRDIAELPELVCKVRPLGINVTSPYKEQVLTCWEHIELSREVKRIGASNVLAFDYSAVADDDQEMPRVYAYNTDVYGFGESLVPLLQGRELYPKALILGTGGAARAVALALEGLGYTDRDYIFVSRDTERAVQSLRALGYSAPRVEAYSSLAQALVHCHIIINATPLGLEPNQAPDIPYHLLTERHLCYDLVYADRATPFLQTAQRFGAMCKNGADMLRLQAEASWAIWQSNLPSSLRLEL